MMPAILVSRRFGYTEVEYYVLLDGYIHGEKIRLYGDL